MSFGFIEHVASGYEIIANEEAATHCFIVNERNNIFFEILHTAKLQKIKEILRGS